VLYSGARQRRRRRRSLANPRRLRRQLGQATRWLSEEAAIRLGIHPHALAMRWRYGARGGRIAELEKFTG